ncbi:protein kinase [Trypanosoma rangeli SC58]|uniref:Protein kinase n=1 Tax=Trypanosoma rangeli SC58 TaxID=429131 RepID=A0A061J3Z3_TRYRA|nr:protein kinase [Trypanosoma rangeli SC58]
MAWLLSGLACAVEKRRLGGDGCVTRAFLTAVDATFGSVVRAMAVLLSAFLTAAEDDAGRRLRDLCARGFVEVWDALLRASPRHGGGALEGLLCDVMQMGHALQSEPATVQLQGPLEAYYVSVLERRCAMRGECVTAAPAASAWWPEAEGRVDAHEHSLLVLRHTLALSEYVSHANCIFQLRHGGARYGRHPAAFFLQGMESLCARFFSTQAESAAQVQVGEIQRVASQIIAVTVRTICTRPGRELFAPLFGKSSGRHATTYTNLLYLCFLEKLHQTPNPDKLCLQALLRALRTLIIWESEAYSIALRLSIPLMLSCILPDAAVAGGVAGTGVRPLTAPVKAPVQELRLASTTTPPVVSTKNMLGNNGGDSSRAVGTAGAAALARLFVPALSLVALPPPQYYAWMGEAEGTCFAVNDNAQAPPLPPLTLIPQLQQPHWGDGVPAVTRSPGKQVTRAVLDDPATLAEVLLLLCCLLPGRSGGMISQSGLVAAHRHACDQTRGPCVDCTCGNVPFVRVLRKVEEFVRCPANEASLQLFDKLVTAEAQETSAFWTGVDVLRRLLSPQPQLLEGITITRRIGAGSYGSVFAAERSSAAAASSQHEMKLGDVSQLLALKTVSIARPDMGDECATLVSCHTEATALLRLQGHAHICELLFVGCTAAHYVLAMPLYKGGSLRDWRVLKSGFPVGELAEGSGCGAATKAASDSTHTSPKGGFLAVCGPIFAQVLAAVEFMHAHGIRHNDIKADNILIESLQDESLSLPAAPRTEEEEGEGEGGSGAHVGPKGRGACIPVAIRLCDFGVCELVGEDMFAVRRCNEAAGGAATSCWEPTRGTEAVQAPEMLSLTGSSAPARRAPCCEVAIPPDAADFPASSAFANVAKELAADMWACGCLLYELLTGVMLFGGANLGRLLFLAANLRSGGRTSHEVLQPHQKHALDMAGPGVAEFVLQLLAVNPAERPTASAARQAWAQVMQAQVM